MRLKNYNEDLVLETVKIVLRDRPDIRLTRSFLLDVAAYALNRIPPKYITSERGFTHEILPTASGNGDSGEKLVNIIELITVVNRAVDVVARRRREEAPSRRRGSSASAESDDARLRYFYNMPHIFGRIVDAASGAPVFSARATLWIDEQFSVPAEPGWRNPTTTNEQTKGYFSFWPRVQTGESESTKVDLRIALEHERYAPYNLQKTVKLAGDFFVHDYIRGDRMLDLGTLALTPS
ncbi:MAG TPA: late competence development ComFB family protein [Spirochaetia bacterium]|nr:late competence development ComFB family protein [Spirochaetia bacterium]